MRTKNLNCPLMGELIDEGICYDIHMKVEGMAPDWTVPEKVTHTPNYKEICLACPNYRED